MTPVVDDFMAGQRPRYIGPELRGPADADGFRVKIGRYGDRWYHNPLPSDHIAAASDWIGPAVSIVKKASGKDWTFTGLKRVADALDTDKYRNLARWPYADRYEALKAINKIGLNAAGQRGTNIHLMFEAFLHGQPCPISEGMPGYEYRGAVEQFFAQYNPTLVAAEFVCIHHTLNGVGYGGTGDAIIELDGLMSQRMRCLVDWKSRGADSEHGAYPEEAAQVGALAGADYIIVEGRDGPERRLMPTLDGGLIVSIKPDGCRIYPVDLDKGFAHWSALHAWWVARRDEREAIGRQWPARKIVEGEGETLREGPGGSPPSIASPPTLSRCGDPECLNGKVFTKIAVNRQWVTGYAPCPHCARIVEGAGAGEPPLGTGPDLSPSTPVSPLAANAVDPGGVGPVADQPPHPPATIDDGITMTAREALAWASQPAPAPLAPLPDHPDEGRGVGASMFRDLETDYHALDTIGRKWISQLVSEAQQAGVGFHAQSTKTERRYGIILGLTTLAGIRTGSPDDDVLRALVTAALGIDAPLDPRHTAGHCVGSLDAAAAQRFATLVDDYVGTSV